MPDLLQRGASAFQKPRSVATQDQLHEAESRSFVVLVCLVEVALLVIYAVELDYDKEGAADSVANFYQSFRDVSIMIFFGFGFLMTFLRRYGASAIGYTLLLSALVVQWSVPLQVWFEDAAGSRENAHFGVLELLNGLFCAAAVMISFGAVLGKTTPTQLVVMAILESVFYWVNVYICAMELEALDIGGGMYIHMFGAYFGLSVAKVLDTSQTRNHPDNASAYTSDTFSLAGTLFLWILWPTFNAAVAAPGEGQLLAIVNTFLSIAGATAAAFAASRLVNKHKFDIVHIQNSTLAGGVAMGVAADLDLHPAGAIGSGIVAGLMSVLGYQYLSPILSSKYGLQDVCGVHNLHGMPGVLAALVGVFATLRISRISDQEAEEFPRREDQYLYQLAATGISLGIAIASGWLTAKIMKFVDVKTSGDQGTLGAESFFNDRGFWDVPSDYGLVVDAGDDVEVGVDETGDEADGDGSVKRRTAGTDSEEEQKASTSDTDGSRKEEMELPQLQTDSSPPATKEE